MISLPTFVGLDYHQDSVQVCVMDRSGRVLSNRSFPNNADLIERACTIHGTPQRIAIEACCGAADLAEELATQRGLPVQLAHPGYVNRMKRSPDKTDYSDAQLLSDLVRVNYLPEVWLAPAWIRELRRLMRLRCQLVRDRKDAKLRIRSLLRENRLKCPYANAWTKAWYTWLNDEAQLSESDRFVLDQYLDQLLQLSGQIAAVEARIKITIKDDAIVAALQEMPGVGYITAATMRAEIGRFDRFNSGKQLARFCGVTPRNASSGAKQADAGLIKAGNPQLRTVLIELAHRLVHRTKGKWHHLAVRMLTHGKKKNVVVAAVANRWVRWVYHEIQRRLSESASAQAQQKGPPLSIADTTA